VGRAPEPSAGILDRQSVKAAEAGGPRGHDAGKKVAGRDRHLLVDTQGLVRKGKALPADVADRGGGRESLLAVDIARRAERLLVRRLARA
jgi:hypothetical protein